MTTIRTAQTLLYFAPGVKCCRTFKNNVEEPITMVATGKWTTLKNPVTTMVATDKSTKQTLEQTTDHNLFCPILTRNVQSHKLFAQLSHFAVLEHATYLRQTLLQ
jgi:hypothetical protein